MSKEQLELRKVLVHQVERCDDEGRPNGRFSYYAREERARTESLTGGLGGFHRLPIREIYLWKNDASNKFFRLEEVALTDQSLLERKAALSKLTERELSILGLKRDE
jgi:hypothetical protein